MRVAAYRSSARLLSRAVTILGIVGTTILAPSASQGAAWPEAITAFSQLPCQFNGRATVMDVAARATLMRIADRDVHYDNRGRKISAIAWFLDELAQGGQATGAKLLVVENAKLLKLIGLEPRPIEGPLQHRYSLEEVEPATDKLIEAQQNTTGEDPEFEAALSEFAGHFVAYREWRNSLKTPPLSSEEEIQAAQTDLFVLEESPLPALVIDKSASSGWMSWPRAAFLAATAANGAVPNESYVQLKRILAAWKQDDVEGFASATADYTQFAKRHSPPAALDFQTPAGWQELGVYIDNISRFEDDTLAHGGAVASFASRPSDDAAMIEVKYFPKPTASVERIVNYWRILIGLAPLPDAELQKTLKPVRVGSFDAFDVDVVEPQIIGRKPPLRVRARLIVRDQDAVIIRCNGAQDEVEAAAAEFDAFVNSLKVGSTEACAAWFHVLEGQPRASINNFSIIVATAKIGGVPWHFRICGPGAIGKESHAAALNFIAKFDGSAFTAGGDPASWTPPEPWFANAGSDDPVNFDMFETADAVRYISAIPLDGYTAASELTLVNLWRTAVEQKPWSAAEAAKQLKTVKAGDVELRMFEVIGPPEPPPGPPPAAPPAPPKS